MVRVSTQVSSVAPAAVEIACPLVIGKEPHAAVEGHGRGVIRMLMQQALETTLAPQVDPQTSALSASIPLPLFRIGGVSPDDHGPVLGNRYVLLSAELD